MGIRHIASYEHHCWQEESVDNGSRSEASLRLTGVQKQAVLGFGGCFNELGWEALQIASNESRKAFLDELFLPEGCNFNYGRIPIGANDFSIDWYSCDDTPDDFALEHFNIERDKQYTIPFIREAQKRQREFPVFASPWSPPVWMKTPKVYNYGIIRMEKQVLWAYADYFVKFVQAYAKEGIDVFQIHVQNEPMSDQKFPSCQWHGEDMRIFIRDYLGPAFEAAGLTTQLWLGTINRSVYDQFANVVLADKEARKYLYGVGLQWGGKSIMEQTAASYPEMHYMQTESECGDGKNSWEYMEYIFEQMWFYFRHGVERYTYWNMALQEGGVSTWGWKQNSLCTVSPKTKELILQPEFYLMKHFSHFVKKGARLLETEGHWAGSTIAFENPDRSVILVVGNLMNRERTFCFEHNGKAFCAAIKPHSIHTFEIQ